MVADRAPLLVGTGLGVASETWLTALPSYG